MPKKNKRTKKNENLFQIAVQNTPDVMGCFQHGLQALGDYSSKIQMEDTRLCNGSIDIDACTVAIYPNDNRWDYAVGYANLVYFVEVHSAETIEVSTVIKKLNWLKTWLNENAPEIYRLSAKQPYYWIQSGKYNILKTSPQAKRIAQAGLKPIPKLKLPV